MQIDSRWGGSNGYDGSSQELPGQGQGTANVIGAEFVLERGSPSDVVICGRDGVPWICCGVPMGNPRTCNLLHASLPLHEVAVTTAQESPGSFKVRHRLTYHPVTDSRILWSTNTVRKRANMSSDHAFQPAQSPSDDKTIIDDATHPKTKDKENQMHRDIVGTGLRSERSTWWLKFIFSQLVTALAMFLYNRLFGNPWRSCPPCEARDC